MMKNDRPVHIIADDREQKSEAIATLEGIEDVAVQVRRLKVGDYQIDNRVIVERKTLKDFAVSIIDGRLFKQAIRLASDDLKGVLILEGTGADFAETGVTREAMQGALITVSVMLGIPVLRSKDPSETARLMVFIARQASAMARGGIQRHGYRPKDKRKNQLYILQGLPGVGLERAVRLLDCFGSVEAVVSASSSELQAVYGIGKGVADKIRWAVKEQVLPFGEKTAQFSPIL